jgi:cob(I)alamin adenosyltransferase
LQGYIHVYTGDGKGKTTAALGLAVRAVGAGLRVYLAQFVKGMHYSELDALPRLSPELTVQQFGRGCFIRNEPTQADIEAARRGLGVVGRVLAAGEHRLVILDEANIAVHYGLFAIDELLSVIEARDPGVEVVVTGRRAHPRLLEAAHLVTEMVEVKHYYNTLAVQARVGIEK